MKERKNILVLAYQISPSRGSEYAVAWNYIIAMSRFHNITVLYGNSGDYLGDNRDMARWLRNNMVENVNFVFVKPNKLSKLLKWPSDKGICSYLFFYAYRVWQWTAYKVARKIVEKEQIDLIHYLGPIGYREQGYLWKINKPYMRGPIGGFDFVPATLLKDQPLTTRIKQNIRTYSSKWVLKYSNKLRKAIKNTDLIVAATQEAKIKLKKYLNVESIYLPENCIVENYPLNEKKFESPKTYNILMAGTLDHRKCNIILLKAINKTVNKDKYTIHLIGDGPTRGVLEKYVVDNHMEDIVKFYGKIPRNRVEELFDIAHLHILTSLSEANTTVIWEAMARGVPTLSLDHCGMHDLINEDSGIKIPVDTIDAVTTNIALALDNLVNNPEKFKTMARAVLEERERYLWRDRCQIFNELYEMTIHNFESKVETRNELY